MTKIEGRQRGDRKFFYSYKKGRVKYQEIQPRTLITGTSVINVSTVETGYVSLREMMRK
jgi:hypothetical protein